VHSALRGKLAHVLWIGGPPDSGKTTIADLIAARHGLPVYHFDRHEQDHLRRADPKHHPAVTALRALMEAHKEAALAHELWLAHPPAAMAEFTIACWSERVTFAVEDLLAMPSHQPVIAEGPGFFPERLYPLLAHPRQAAWLIPTEAFKRASATRRDKPGSRHLTTDPAQAQEKLILRDLIVTDHIRQHAAQLGLATYDIDGTRSPEEMVARIETHFVPWLRGLL
jgi:hypothetical protein